MELKRIYLNDGVRFFEFEEGKERHHIRLTVPDPDFGYFAQQPSLLLRESPKVVDEKLPEDDVVLTFIGRERVLTVALMVIHHLADVIEVPLQLLLEERFRQKILTVFSSRRFFDIDKLEMQLMNILSDINDQLPVLKETTENENDDPTFDPLDHIGEENVSIYSEEEENHVLELNSLSGEES